MDFEIAPEPSAQERAAIAAALADLAAQDEPSAWWRGGLLESLEEEPEG